MTSKTRKIVIVNQAANYLTIGFCNAFLTRFDKVALITGSIHTQGEELDKSVDVSRINKWRELYGWRKMLSYINGAIRVFYLLIFKYSGYEVIFVSLPPMGYLLSIFLPHRCSVIVWDLFPDAFKIIGWSEKNMVYRLWAAMNRLAFEKAHRLITISDVMSKAITKYVDPQKIRIQPIWSIFQEEKPIKKSQNKFISMHNLEGKFIVQYSGNIGLSHKAELMISMAELMTDDKDVLFQIIGRGPRKPYLQKLVEEKGLSNCQFLPFQDDDMFPYSLSSADLGVVILDELTSVGSVPSKSYNLMSFGIPSVYIASKESQLHHYAEEFGHAICLQENQLDQAVDFIRKLKADNPLLQSYKLKSRKAASNFKRSNADKFVDIYLQG